MKDIAPDHELGRLVARQIGVEAQASRRPWHPASRALVVEEHEGKREAEERPEGQHEERASPARARHHRAAQQEGEDIAHRGGGEEPADSPSPAGRLEAIGEQHDPGRVDARHRDGDGSEEQEGGDMPVGEDGNQQRYHGGQPGGDAEDEARVEIVSECGDEDEGDGGADLVCGGDGSRGRRGQLPFRLDHGENRRVRHGHGRARGPSRAQTDQPERVAESPSLARRARLGPSGGGVSHEPDAERITQRNPRWGRDQGK